MVAYAVRKSWLEAARIRRYVARTWSWGSSKRRKNYWWKMVSTFPGLINGEILSRNRERLP